MRKVLVGLIALMASTAASAQVYVHGYTRSNGTYVAPYYRTTPDSSILNNYSTYPNVNPYTGKVGTVNPYAPSTLYSNPSPSYGYEPQQQPCYYNCPPK